LELATYIANQAGGDVAHRYVDRVETLCQALAEFPERGKPRSDIAPGLRTITMERRVTVVYRVSPSRVDIVTIAYGGRDFERDLKQKRRRSQDG
jgi:toxin ParE1/3/4